VYTLQSCGGERRSSRLRGPIGPVTERSESFAYTVVGPDTPDIRSLI
jgi:hypothetical protein